MEHGINMDKFTVTNYLNFGRKTHKLDMKLTPLLTKFPTYIATNCGTSPNISVWFFWHPRRSWGNGTSSCHPPAGGWLLHSPHLLSMTDPSWTKKNHQCKFEFFCSEGWAAGRNSRRCPPFDGGCSCSRSFTLVCECMRGGRSKKSSRGRTGRTDQAT